MPRETIFIPHPVDPASPDFRPFQVQVGWQTDQEVQVGITTHDDRHLVDYIYASEQEAIGRALWDRLREEGWVEIRDFRTSEAEEDFMKQMGRHVLDSVTGSTPFGTSVWVTMGRHQINQFVNLLRKARDKAYGKDA